MQSQWSVSRAVCFKPSEDPPVPIEKELNGLQEPGWDDVQERKPSCCGWESNQIPWLLSPLSEVIHTELSTRGKEIYCVCRIIRLYG
jgi:hypothetical protein